MGVNIQKLRSDFSRLEKKRDSLLESRDFDNLKICLDELDRLKNELALHDADSQFAHELRVKKAQQIFNNKRGLK